MIKLYGHPGSTCTRKVLMTAAELSIPCDFTLVDLAKAEQKQPAHLARQPFGQIPAIDDDGFGLFESRAICRYLNDKAKGPLLGSDLKTRALVEQWISVETSNFAPHAMKFVYHHLFRREQDPAVLENAEKALEKALTILDAHLASSTFLVGSQLTLADICYMPYLEYAMATPAKGLIAKHPHVLAWWGRLSERPTWLKTVGR